VLASDGQAFMNRKNLGLMPEERDWREMAKLNGSTWETVVRSLSEPLLWSFITGCNE